MARILALSSHVVRGNVGLAATVPALQALGHEVWAVPTITLAARPGLGHAAGAPGGRRAATAEELAGLLDALERDGCWPMLDAVFTGYFANAATVRAAAAAIRRIKQANPHTRVLVDPIIGDGGRLYVAVETAEAVACELLPLAEIATPNLFELQWLSGRFRESGSGAGEVFDTAAAARALGPPIVAVTSASVTATDVTTLVVHGDACHARSTARLDAIPNGSGDLFDGLLLGNLLAGLTVPAALHATVGRLAEVLAASSGRDVLQLSALCAAGTVATAQGPTPPEPLE